MDKKLTIMFVKQGWSASFLSDLQTFGFMAIPFAANVHYMNNNGWLNFIITVMFFLWIVARLGTKSGESKHIIKFETKDLDEAIEFINKQREAK